MQNKLTYRHAFKMTAVSFSQSFFFPHLHARSGSVEKATICKQPQTAPPGDKITTRPLPKRTHGLKITGFAMVRPYRVCAFITPRLAFRVATPRGKSIMPYS